VLGSLSLRLKLSWLTQPSLVDDYSIKFWEFNWLLSIWPFTGLDGGGCFGEMPGPSRFENAEDLSLSLIKRLDSVPPS